MKYPELVELEKKGKEKKNITKAIKEIQNIKREYLKKSLLH